MIHRDPALEGLGKAPGRHDGRAIGGELVHVGRIVVGNTRLCGGVFQRLACNATVGGGTCPYTTQDAAEDRGLAPMGWERVTEAG